MIYTPIEIEGTSEHIATQAALYSGFNMHLTVLPDISVPMQISSSNQSLDEKLAAILATVPPDEWSKLPQDMGGTWTILFMERPRNNENCFCRHPVLVRLCQRS